MNWVLAKLFSLITSLFNGFTAFRHRNKLQKISIKTVFNAEQMKKSNFSAARTPGHIQVERGKEIFIVRVKVMNKRLGVGGAEGRRDDKHKNSKRKKSS